MQKVYLLLRNNQQTGPFNLQELIQFNLKPFDLIWIEGKSAGWYYPQEIKALHPHLPFVKQAATQTSSPLVAEVKATNATPRKVFVSMPGIATKEPLSPPSFAAPKQEPAHPSYQASEVKTTYAKPIEEVEADYTSWVYNQKTKKKQGVLKKGLMAACFMVTIAFAGWWAVNKFSASAESTTQVQASIVPVQSQSPSDSSFSASAAITPIKKIVKKGKENRPTVVTKTLTAERSNSLQEDRKTPASSQLPIKENEYGPSDAVGQESKPVIEEKKPEPIAEAPKEKKKLRDKILDIFKKKPEAKTQEAKPAEEEEGERKTSRRESGASLAQLVSLHFSIPNDWMMGIKSAKATLVNKSNEVVASASVEVLYYNDDNELLDRKMITFKNIGSKGSQTVSVPDHATATRLESKIISATGAAEPYAKL